MRISPVRLPRLLGTLVMAFAPYEPLPLLGAAQLFSGMAIELAYRWATGQVIADPTNRAVLLWSMTSRGVGRRRLCRELSGVLVATVVGICLVVINNTILLLPLGVMLVSVGAPTGWVADVVLAVIGMRLLVIGWRAAGSYRNEVALTARLPSAATPRWRIDFLAATPARSGYGGLLLDTFLRQADERGAEVVLHCERRNVAFYRKHGFQLLPVNCPGDQHLMVRHVRTVSGHPGGHPRKALRRSGISRSTSRLSARPAGALPDE
jgi:GNAT superfamily N-acetyltransferase